MRYIFACLLLIVITLSCRSASDEKIHVGFNTWIGYQAVALADKNGFFQKQGLKIKLNNFRALYDVMRAFEDGKIDVIFSTSMEVIQLASRGQKIKIIYISDYSNGADGIVAKKSIKDISGLRGRRVGVEVGSISHFTLLKALATRGMADNDVKIVNQTVHESSLAFKKGKIDAMVSWEPHLQNAVREQKANRLFTSKDIPGQIIDTMAVRQKLLDERPEDCAKLIRAYLATLNYIEIEKEKAHTFLAKSYGVSLKDYRRDLQGVKMTGIKQNLEIFGTPQNPGPIYASTTDLIKFSRGQGILKKSVKAQDIIDGRFLKMAQE